MHTVSCNNTHQFKNLNFSVPYFEKEGNQKKNECLGGLKNSYHGYFPGDKSSGQKKTVDLGLF